MSTTEHNAPHALDVVVDALARADDASWPAHDRPLPSHTAISSVVEALHEVLFPGRRDAPDPAALRYHVGATVDRVERTLQHEIHRALFFARANQGAAERATAIARAFVMRLPELRRLLHLDLQAAFDGDPAASSLAEVLFCYPGLQALLHHRIAHELQLLEVPLLPRMIAERAHSLTGIDIHPGARIGERFFIDHGTGVVIGETAIIGERVRLYQGVTLGAKSFPLDEHGRPKKGVDRHPVIEDDVIIYSGATILGRVTVGRGSVVGGNVWLTRSVPPHTQLRVQPPTQERFEGGGGI